MLAPLIGGLLRTVGLELYRVASNPHAVISGSSSGGPGSLRTSGAQVLKLTCASGPS
ncbi:MAG: hypothetical protein JWO67_4259 [Streptosporangiaceae bacterium]|nr:hypothetical protein [Streptosporangiaceae bacterium]